MSRYIDADVLKEECYKFKNNVSRSTMAFVQGQINAAPTVNVAPRADVAMEIFEEIEGLMWDAVIGGKYPAKVINPDKFAELKQKYESEGAE